MALDPAQIDTLAEIIQDTYDNTEALIIALDFEAATETRIAADIVLWNENRNDVDAELASGTQGGVNWRAARLLDAIRERIRKAFGLSLYSSEVQQTSTSVCNTWIY